MSQVATTQPPNPFARTQLPEHVSAGAVAIESERAIAEAQGKLVIAKRFPRDEAAAFQRVMDACARPSLAGVAMYAFPRGGQTVAGPSIRLAEELARCWGNIDYGIRELSRKDGVSEMEAYAWDLQTNTMSSMKFTVRHIRDRKSSNGGNQALTDERDIYELTANMGGRRLRARLLAILPPDLVDAAVGKCRKTLDGDSELPLADRIRRTLAAFAKIGVTAQHLSDFLKKPVDSALAEDLTELHTVFLSIKDGMAKPSDYFDRKEDESRSNAAFESLNKQITQAPANDNATEATQAEQQG